MSYNPFQNADLVFPNKYYDKVNDYCQTHASDTRRSLSQAPFPRMVDIWFLAFCIGATRRSGESVEVPHKFHTGSVFQGEEHRVKFIELVAIAYSNDPWIIDKPNEVIRIANQLVASGLPNVLAMLDSGSAEPIWNLSDNLEALMMGDDVSLASANSGSKGTNLETTT